MSLSSLGFFGRMRSGRKVIIRRINIRRFLRNGRFRRSVLHRSAGLGRRTLFRRWWRRRFGLMMWCFRRFTGIRVSGGCFRAAFGRLLTWRTPPVTPAASASTFTRIPTVAIPFTLAAPSAPFQTSPATVTVTAETITATCRMQMTSFC